MTADIADSPEGRAASEVLDAVLPSGRNGRHVFHLKDTISDVEGVIKGVILSPVTDRIEWVHVGPTQAAPGPVTALRWADISKITPTSSR